jgi:hypothetical protein
MFNPVSDNAERGFLLVPDGKRGEERCFIPEVFRFRAEGVIERAHGALA